MRDRNFQTFPVQAEELARLSIDKPAIQLIDEFVQQFTCGNNCGAPRQRRGVDLRAELIASKIEESLHGGDGRQRQPISAPTNTAVMQNE